MLRSTKSQARITSSRGYDEAREAFRQANLGNKYAAGVRRVVSEEQKRKLSQAMTGRMVGDLNPSKSPDVQAKISAALMGVPKSPDHVSKMVANGKKLIQCPFCLGSFDHRNARKWHFDFCKENPDHKPRPSTNFFKGNSSGNKKVECLETGKIYRSVKEAAGFFEVHPISITRWIKKGVKLRFA
jgi:hypothetical protein